MLCRITVLHQWIGTSNDNIVFRFEWFGEGESLVNNQTIKMWHVGGAEKVFTRGIE
jgi:hypothetical protein